MIPKQFVSILVAAFVSLGLFAHAGPWEATAQTIERRAPVTDPAEQRPGLFRDKCGRCHKRAAPLVFGQMSLDDGVLFTAEKGQDLRVFLRRHYGRPKDDEIAAIYAALLRVAQGKGRFKTRCGICHESAEQVAKEFLIRRDGRLFGRYTGRDIAVFLQRHGTDSLEEAAFFTSVLERQPVPRP